MSKEELMEVVWPGTFVEEMNLTQNISVLRRALGDSAHDPLYIVTVSGRGYRFAQHVTRLLQAEMAPEEPSGSPPQLEIASPSGRARAVVRFRTRLAVLIVILAALVLVGVSRKSVEEPYSYGSNLRDFQLTRLTDTGQIAAAAVAPDGRYIAYVVSDGDRSSLWIGQTATHGRAQVLELRAAKLDNVAFSPDGSYLYFTLAENSAFQDLYRVPTLGGAARLLVHDVDTPVTFSPDQKSIAFMRGAPQRGEFYLVRADAEGGSEKVLATERRPLEFEFAGPAWSPDGKLIAASIQDYTTQRRWAIDVISAEDGSAREVFRSPHMIGRLRWAPDGKGLLTVISDTPASPGALGGVQQQGGQIWWISYPGGETRRLTNDLANYDPCCLDLTADGKTVTAVQNTIVADIWVAPTQAPEQMTRSTSGPPVVRRHAWLPDSTTILYRDIKGDLYKVSRHGGNPTLLTPPGHTVVSPPSACGDGRYVVFKSVPEGGSFGIWRMEVDGANPVQLVEAKPDTQPQCSVDGKWVYFSEGRSDEFILYRVPIEGGAATELLANAGAFLQSPGGKSVLYVVEEGRPPRAGIVIADLETGERRHVSIPSEGRFGSWAPDESGIDIIRTRNGVSNIWRFPFNGAPPKQLTHFSAGQIFAMSWSPDARWLAINRGEARSDVVALHYLH